jgi:hypothetical protein
MRRLTSLMIAGALTLLACAPDTDVVREAAGTFARYDAGGVPGGPGTGKRYAFGRSPTAGELSALATAVAPDGMVRLTVRTSTRHNARCVTAREGRASLRIRHSSAEIR